MLQGVLLLALCAGVLVEPFRIADAESGHHQGCVCAAMTPDGRFAVAWIDHLLISHDHGDLYIRFFNQNGSPLTDPYNITKMVDTNRIYWPCLKMDTAGNAILLYAERAMSVTVPENKYIRFQRFAPDGNPVVAAQTLVPQIRLDDWRTIGLSVANSGEFAVVWCTYITSEGYGTCVQRFDMDGYPKGDAFLANDPDTSIFCLLHPEVALNDKGDLVVTWLEWHVSGETYPRFQAFDAEDEPILDWEPMGHRVDDGEEIYNGSRTEVSWFDDERFVVFWKDDRVGSPEPRHPAARVFSDRGLTHHPIRWLVWEDTMWLYFGGTEGCYSTAVAPNDSFTYTHIRTYSERDTSDPWERRNWEHGGGILGYIQDNEPIRRTNLFEYTPPWGADTVDSYFDNHSHVEAPAVACSNDRIVWVYSRLNLDTIFEAFAMITDWDMGVGVEEPAPKTVSPIELRASLNRLSYDVSGSVTGQAKLTLYSSDGRKVLEETIEGKGIWTPPPSPSSQLSSGVYFARVSTQGHSARAKVVILH